MPSLFDIGKSGLQAYRQSLAVTGQNIANVNTKGYKKRDASLAEVSGAGGGITVAHSGSAAGTIDSAEPTAANQVEEGGSIEMITDGASTGANKLNVTFVIRR